MFPLTKMDKGAVIIFLFYIFDPNKKASVCFAKKIIYLLWYAKLLLIKKTKQYKVAYHACIYQVQRV